MAACSTVKFIPDLTVPILQCLPKLWYHNLIRCRSMNREFVTFVVFPQVVLQGMAVTTMSHVLHKVQRVVKSRGLFDYTFLTSHILSVLFLFSVYGLVYLRCFS